MTYDPRGLMITTFAGLGSDDQDEMGRCSIEMTQTSCRATQSFGFGFGRSGFRV